jgi:hypothetical protein
MPPEGGIIDFKICEVLNTHPKLIRRLLLALGMGEKVIRRPPVELIPAPQLTADQDAQSSQSHAHGKPPHHAQRFVLTARLNN